MTLPTPRHWPDPPLRRRDVTALLAAGVALVAGGTAARLGTGKGGLAAVGFGGFVLCIAYTHLPRSTRVESRRGALVVPRSLARAAVLNTVCVAALVAFVFVYDGVPRVLSAALFAVVGAVGAVRAVRNGVRGHVALDPDGVTVAMPGARARVPWAEVGRLDFGRRARFAVTVDGERRYVRTEWFPVDPVVLFWTLRYYATHPESRDELADERAVERVRRQDLEPEPAATSALASGS